MIRTKAQLEAEKKRIIETSVRRTDEMDWAFRAGFDANTAIMIEREEVLRTRIDGTILALQTHRQNIDPDFLIKWLSDVLIQVPELK